MTRLSIIFELQDQSYVTSCPDQDHSFAASVAPDQIHHKQNRSYFYFALNILIELYRNLFRTHYV